MTQKQRESYIIATNIIKESSITMAKLVQIIKDQLGRNAEALEKAKNLLDEPITKEGGDE